MDKLLLERIELEKRVNVTGSELRQTSAALSRERSHASKRSAAYSERMTRLDTQISSLEHSLRSTRATFKDHAGSQTRGALHH